MSIFFDNWAVGWLPVKQLGAGEIPMAVDPDPLAARLRVAVVGRPSRPSTQVALHFVMAVRVCSCDGSWSQWPRRRVSVVAMSSAGGGWTNVSVVSGMAHSLVKTVLRIWSGRAMALCMHHSLVEGVAIAVCFHFI
jgi:hypothetical protein